jgi:hypothetical protein
MPPLCSCPRIGTIPAGAEGPTPGAGLQGLGGVPLIMRAMLIYDERVCLSMLACDAPMFRR